MSLLKHQAWHVLGLLFLVVIMILIINSDVSFSIGELWGIETVTWFWIAIIIPILHQIYVLLCWRFELLHQSISKRFGSKGFKGYKIGFTILILSRVITITLLALSNTNTLTLSTTLQYLFILVLLIPAVYLFYSVKNYFGFDRAFGIDHFEPEKAKHIPFVKKGIFKYTSNGMYLYGFLILWVPGLLFLSKAAIIAALFNHLYIWIHYYCTELPDIKYIYPKK